MKETYVVLQNTSVMNEAIRRIWSQLLFVNQIWFLKTYILLFYFIWNRNGLVIAMCLILVSEIQFQNCLRFKSVKLKSDFEQVTILSKHYLSNSLAVGVPFGNILSLSGTAWWIQKCQKLFYFTCNKILIKRKGLLDLIWQTKKQYLQELAGISPLNWCDLIKKFITLMLREDYRPPGWATCKEYIVLKVKNTIGQETWTWLKRKFLKHSCFESALHKIR